MFPITIVADGGADDAPDGTFPVAAVDEEPRAPNDDDDEVELECGAESAVNGESGETRCPCCIC